MSDFNNLHMFAQQSKSYFSSINTKSIRIGAEKFSYLEAGKGETIILLHCFNGAKNVWRILANHLKEHYHVLAPDIPGLDVDVTISDTRRFSFRFLTKLVDDFAQALGIEEFHLAGASGGSTLAASYALKHPEKVKTVTLIGMPSLFREELHFYQEAPKPAEFFVPTTIKDLEAVSKEILVQPSKVSAWMSNRFLSKNREYREFKIQVLNDILKTNSLIVPKLRSLSPPILFIHGEQDPITPQATIDHLCEIVPNIRRVTIPKGSHMVYMERALQVNASLHQFLQANAGVKLS